MTDYTPTTEEVREYVSIGGEYRPWDAPDSGKESAREAAFDRWLAQHDREVAAKALRDFVADQDDMREAFDSIQGSGITPVELVTYRAIKQAERIEAGEGCEPDLAHNRKIAAEALREFAVEVAGELAETKAKGIDLGSDYLHGMRSALMQATDRADRIEQGGQE